MIKEDYVSLEVAKLLKEKGYDEPCETEVNICLGTWGYCDYDHVGVRNSNLPTNKASYPTLYEVQKWLRENHNCYVQVTHEAYKTGVNNLVQVLFYEPNDDDCWSNESTGVYGDNAEFETYEEALNFGILEALKRI